MIAARLAGAATWLVRLAAKAETLASSEAESRRRAVRADPTRWRRPGLLWPLFTKD